MFIAYDYSFTIKKSPAVFLQRILLIRVELEGFEPSSTRGNHTLSTRLSWTAFSCHGKTQATNRNLIP